MLILFFLWYVGLLKKLSRPTILYQYHIKYKIWLINFFERGENAEFYISSLYSGQILSIVHYGNKSALLISSSLPKL